jgi:hypothetical protein
VFPAPGSLIVATCTHVSPFPTTDVGSPTSLAIHARISSFPVGVMLAVVNDVPGVTDPPAVSRVAPTATGYPDQPVPVSALALKKKSLAAPWVARA